MTAPALASIFDVEAVAKPVPASDVDRVTRLIRMVSANVVRYTGQQFVLVENDEVELRPSDGRLRLPQRPVRDLTSVVINDRTLDSSLYTWTTSGHLRRVASTALSLESSFFGVGGDVSLAWPVNGELPWPPVPVTVTYSHGYPADEYPEDVAMVVAEKAAVKWLRGATDAEGVMSEQIDGYSVAYAKLAHISAGNAWDPEHAEILDSYRGSRTTTTRLG